MSDQLARLLATENIRVVRKTTSTASFDIANRVLTLPIFKETFSKKLEHLFVGHEVSHALHTTFQTIMDNVTKYGKKEYRKYKDAINITEDARIDALIKRKYPGLKSDYGAGLKELRSMDFFNLNGKNFYDLNLLDKVNIFFKGYPEVYGIFNDVEKNLIERIEASTSQQMSIDLGIELYNMALADKNKRQEEPKEKSDEDESEGDSEEGSGSEDDSKEDKTSSDEGEDSEGGEESEDDASEESSNKSEKSKKSENKEVSEDMEEDSYGDKDESIECETQKAFDENLNKELETSSFAIRTVTIDNDLHNLNSPIHTYKDILNGSKWSKNGYPKFKDDGFNAFKKASSNRVNALVKEFEMRKAATRYSRSQVSKSGYLDMNKIYSYQYNDDIFKRITSFKDEKNHGMVFLLDWSGSMVYQMHDVIEQLYVLTTFCRQVKIPFSVYAFTSIDSKEVFPRFFDSKDNRDELGKASDYITRDLGKFNLSAVRPFNLLEFFSSSMNDVEYNEMYCRLWNTPFSGDYVSNTLGIYALRATPLNSALAFMYFYLPIFKNKFNVEKMTFINLTDGGSHALTRNSGISKLANKNNFTSANMHFSFISPRTRKEYFLEDIDGNRLNLNSVCYGDYINLHAYETNALIRMIKDDGITCISISIAKGHSEFTDAIMILTGKHRSKCKEAATRESKIIPSFYDKSFLIYSKNLKDARKASDSLDIILDGAKDASTAKLARSISIQQNKIKESQIILNAFIGTIA